MELGLAGKNILVTGSAGLIGAELCGQLGESGANVILADMSAKNADVASIRRRHDTSMIVSFIAPSIGGHGAERV